MRWRLRQLERLKVPASRRRLREQIVLRYAEEIEHLKNIRLELETDRNFAMDDLTGRERA